MTTRRLLPILGQPNPSEPRDVHLVGRYALGGTWADGHSSISPFEHLRRGAPAAADDRDPARETSPEPTQEAEWPRDIKRTAEGLRVTWADGHESLYPYPELRGQCRCAGCTGGH